MVVAERELSRIKNKYYSGIYYINKCYKHPLKKNVRSINQEVCPLGQLSIMVVTNASNSTETSEGKPWLKETSMRRLKRQGLALSCLWRKSIARSTIAVDALRSSMTVTSQSTSPPVSTSSASIALNCSYSREGRQPIKP